MRNDEKSTSLNLMGDEDEWELYTDDSTIMTKLRRAGLEPYKENSTGGYFYKVPKNRISFRKESKRKPLTEKQRLAAAKRLENAREAKEQ